MNWPSENLDELLAQAKEILHAAGAREVYVFGSAGTRRMNERSDIDLAVTGLPKRIYFATMAKLSDLFDRPVDLVDLDVSNHFTTYLRNKKGLLRRVA